jgi:hypothetical protein
VVGRRPTLSVPVATDEGNLDGAYRVDVSALTALGLFRPTPRAEAIDGVVRDCLSRRAELSD